MKKKHIILIIIIFAIIITPTSFWYIHNKNKYIICPMIDLTLPSGYKYITKDIHSVNSVNENIDHYVIEIPSGYGVDFMTEVDDKQWIKYDKNQYNFYFNNWVGKILKKKIPLLGIDSAWMILFDLNKTEININNCSKETLNGFVFAIYDWQSDRLHVLKWVK